MAGGPGGWPEHARLAIGRGVCVVWAMLALRRRLVGASPSGDVKGRDYPHFATELILGVAPCPAGGGPPPTV